MAARGWPRRAGTVWAGLPCAADSRDCPGMHGRTTAAAIGTARPRAAAMGAMLAAMVVGTGACGGDDGAPAPPGERAEALWSEFLDDAAVRAELPWLAAHDADLYLAIEEARIGDAALAGLVRDAAAAGVGVRAWLLLDEADGYWPSEVNIPATREAALALLDWRDAEALPIDWLVFDLEMNLTRTREIAALVASQGGSAAIDAIKAGRDPVAFAAHTVELTALVDELRARDVRVAAVTYPMVLDDAADGDTEIQDGLDAPVDGPAWDEVSFMVYQSLVYDLSGAWHGPDLIYSYASTARARFGERAAVALGIVGQAGITPVAMPYPDAPTFVADRGAARAAGVTRVSTYSLDGLAPLPAAERDAWMSPGAVRQPTLVDAEILRGVVRNLLD